MDNIKEYSIAGYARLMNVNRRTIYNRIKVGDPNIEVTGRKGKQKIRVNIAEQVVFKDRPVDFSNIGVSELTIADLASLCTMFKLTHSPESYAKFTLLSNELDKRLSSVFV